MVRSIAQFFRHEGIEVTPWIALRIDEAVTSYAIAVQLEQALHTHGVFLVDPKEQPTSEGEQNSDGTKPSEKPKVPAEPRRLHPAVDQSAKARDRFRKALQELQTACENTTARSGTSWAEAIAERLKTLPPIEDGSFAEFLATDDPKRQVQLLNQLTAEVKK
jgi:hypothetical protein